MHSTLGFQSEEVHLPLLALKEAACKSCPNGLLGNLFHLVLGWGFFVECAKSSYTDQSETAPGPDWTNWFQLFLWSTPSSWP